MLYLLLYPLSSQLKLFNVLRYPSFRIVAAGLTAMVLGLLLGPLFIERMREIQYGASNVREDTPETHKKKAGTPSMGGLLILLSLVLSTLLFADLRSRLIWAALTVTVGFGAIGFADDWLKISKRDSKGLAGRRRLLLEAGIVLARLLPLPHRPRRSTSTATSRSLGEVLPGHPPDAPLRPHALLRAGPRLALPAVHALHRGRARPTR